jgi:hypothetical protein
MRKMWFGTKKFARWIKVHSPGSTYTAAGHSTRMDYLSGGVGLRRSLGGHEERQLTWNRLTEQEARDITDFAYGAFGDGPFYLSDPGAQRLNVLNKNWSMPGLSGKDGVPLAGNRRPALVPNPDQSRGYPVDMAQYRLDGTEPRRSFYVPVPPGHVAWVGVHGDPDSNGGVQVQPTVSGVPAGAATIVPVAGVDTAERVTHSFTPVGDQAGIELSLEAGQPITNLFTNPSFETGSGAVEVRRNRATYPTMLNATDGWSNGGAVGDVTRTPTADGIQVDLVAAMGTGNSLFYNTTQYPVAPGESWIGGFTSVTVPVGYPAITVRAVQRIYGNPSQTDGAGATVTINPGETKAVLSAPATAPADAINSRVILQPVVNTMPAGARLIVKNALVEKATVLGEYFDGTFSPDSDMTASWVGAANSSESVLTGTPITGVTPLNCVAIRSTQWVGSGAYSMRVIPTVAGVNNSYVDLGNPAAGTNPAPANSTVTLLATRRLESALTGALSANAGTVTVYDGGFQKGNVLPNAAGIGEVRVVGATGATSSTRRTMLHHGGAQGSGDVWWDLALLASGLYTGPYFDGGTPGASWNGAANASTSTLTSRTTTLAGMVVQVLPQGVTPEPGGFISGQGMSGADFDGIVRPTPYSYAHGSYGLSVNLVENEEWL